MLEKYILERKQSLAKEWSAYLSASKVPGLEERHLDGILRAAKACLIHNTMLGSPSIEVVVNAAELARV